MQIDDATWNEIIAKTEADIARWNERAAEKNRPDRFTANVKPVDKYTVIVTEHQTGYRVERKAVAREVATGELRKAQIVKKGSGLACKITASPKSWAKLEGKSADQTFKALKLTDYIMLLGVRAETPVAEAAPRDTLGNFAVLEEDANGVPGLCHFVGSSMYPPLNLASHLHEEFCTARFFPSRESAQRAADEMRQRDLKRRDKKNTQYAVVEITNETAAEIEAKWRAGSRRSA